MTISENLPKFKTFGTRPIRHDGLDKVTGRARYGADVHLPGMLVGKVLRSPYAHAKILSVDTSKAEALPGVKAIVTYKDFPIISGPLVFGNEMGNSRIMAENMFATEKVLYKGHAIAAVAATDAHIAEEAIGLIDVKYEPLEPVLTVHDAMREGAPILHDTMTTLFKVERFGKGEDTGVKSNVASQIQFKRGDLDKAFGESELVIEREFNTKTVHQGYIEPHSSTASWSQDGRLTVWTSTQGIFGIRDATAAILGIPASQVKVVAMEIGGGFGGKTLTYIDPVVAQLSKKTGRPVKITMTRKEVFEGTGPTSGTYMRCKIGVDKDAHITAAELHMAYEAGAFPGSPVGGGAMSGLGPYKIDNLIVDGLDVVCNKQKVAAYRAPGQPQAAFAVETVMDELAEKLGLDPLEFRMMNAAQEGDRAPSGVPHLTFGNEEVERAMKEHDHYNAPLEGPNKGRGVAVGYRLNGGGSGSAATINVNADGTINLLTGSMDIGGSRAAIAMQAAEVLGISSDDVNPQVVDTDSIGWTGTTGGSRITFDTGRAAINTANEVIQKMSERAALLWEVQSADVDFEDGVFICTKNTEDRFTFKELSAKLMDTGGPVTCSGIDKQGGVGAQLAGHIVDVEVDPETGKVDILRYTTFIDAGRAAHPSYVEGQMQGGALQGIGWALNEEYYFTDDGTVANSSFLDYRMPTSLDLPMIDTVIIEVPNDRHPFGIRGVGETVLIPPMAAIANAIHDAIGVRMTKLPMSPGAILEALEDAG
ncbi:MAG: xanthine dehydrogenase family protein molybdopterin-binding subunit [Dehalococcoidia bacterium]|nr:oxidoreductase [Chloroflexota bacterium]MCH2525593.1 xanthine dehydrogenase family protein molybdopterin-binding subunit [Dehalococcoidia bacterium]MQF99873.1 xanthine dehydrogenase family protein molybdopterin-binding subunit [SAR202 cluster bacterium]|tara:strand:- start:1235 stop:3520 length:2286 start_codon:yes stop_codon:yes gene_type:complete